jgi:flagellar basal body-associated protein FliL
MTDDHDHDTVVVKESGSSTGIILGILAVIIVLAGLWYFAMGPGSSGGGTTTQENNPDVNIEVPVEPVEPNPS